MKQHITERGFSILFFWDTNNLECSLQSSSTATEECIWLGFNKNRMHLNQKQVKKLLPYLKNFVETGEIFKDK